MSVIEHIREHPYFWANLLSTAWLTALGALLLRRSDFRLSIISGLLNAPCFVFLRFLEGSYWTPVRLGAAVLDAGDVLCSYAVAAMAWFALTAGQRRRITAAFSWRVFLVRYNAVAGLSVVCFLAVYAAGMEGMTALVVTCLAVALVLFVRLRSFRAMALESMLRFGVLYFAVVKVYFAFWPAFVKQWNPVPPWGVPVAGVPLGEIVWSLVFGAYWALFMAFVFRMAITKEDGAPA
ncbi:MAG: hypothetical protein K1X78_04190 [Verrucomicrobiaceae bacterium]|nr:hypothetical protein [Verrucomicrobiaceae bacterium]